MNLSTLIDIIKRKKRAYSAVFFCEKVADGLTEDGAVVVADFMEFCEPYSTSQVLDKAGQTDIYGTGVKEGKRLAFLHLTKQLNLEDADIIQITNKLQNIGG